MKRVPSSLVQIATSNGCSVSMRRSVSAIRHTPPLGGCADLCQVYERLPESSAVNSCVFHVEDSDRPFDGCRRCGAIGVRSARIIRSRTGIAYESGNRPADRADSANRPARRRAGKPLTDPGWGRRKSMPAYTDAAAVSIASFCPQSRRSCRDTLPQSGRTRARRPRDRGR
jgi:hypothetical protein